MLIALKSVPPGFRDNRFCSPNITHRGPEKEKQTRSFLQHTSLNHSHFSNLSKFTQLSIIQRERGLLKKALVFNCLSFVDRFQFKVGII